jgi:catechol 2,3-dioxygenase-like lactoylglutathione lyase family enzyme
MASIENLRKQAKQFVRWHRQRHFPVAAIIRSHVPRFASSSDLEILESSFALTEAQELVARRAGFDSWSALLGGIETMNEATVQPRKAELTGAEPQLFVTDMNSSLEYYREIGFEVVFAYGEPAFYCQLQRDGVPLNLRLVPMLPFDPERMREESLLAVTILTNDVKQLYLEFSAASVEFHQQLKKEPWGARTFVVRDPDGNLVLFAGAG